MTKPPAKEPRPGPPPVRTDRARADRARAGPEQRSDPFRPARSVHGSILLLSLLILAASASLSVSGERDVVVPIINRALPGTCTFHRLTGWDCPGCGLTRSFVSLAHGQLGRAMHFHALGIVLFAAVVVQIPYRLWRLRRDDPGRATGSFGSAQKWTLVGFVAVLLLHWFVRILTS